MVAYKWGLLWARDAPANCLSEAFSEAAKCSGWHNPQPVPERGLRELGAAQARRSAGRGWREGQGAAGAGVCRYDISVL